MRISMSVSDTDGSLNSSTFDEVDIRESGQTIGEAIGEAIDMELSYPKTVTITLAIRAR